MVDFLKFLPYLLVMAGVTYAVRVLPLLLVRKKFKNRFIKSFIYYIPYSVLGVMTIPAVFYSTTHALAATIGFTAAVIEAYFKDNLILTTLTACVFAFGAELIITLL